MPTYPCPAELAYFRCLEAERIGLTGQEAIYYTLTRGANVDPLYSEPDDGGWVYDDFRLTVTAQYQEMDNKEVGVQEDGATVEYDAEAVVALNEWEANGPPTIFPGRKPKHGDVILVMGHYFDVVKGSAGGNVVDQIAVVGYKLMLKKRVKFDARRRLSLNDEE